jgi:hypothetical protein
MRSLNTLSLIGASLLHVTRGHMTQEIPSATIPTLIIYSTIISYYRILVILISKVVIFYK